MFDWNNLTDSMRMAVLYKTIFDNKYIPADVKPHAKQRLFLENFSKEILYGGAAGGGKSIALLIAALMFVEVPGYKALILRRNYSQLVLPGALIEVADGWLRPTDAHWDSKERQWTFSSGATLNFGYLDVDADKYRYQGAEFHFVGFDELTQFTESMYTYLFSRTRKTQNSILPLRFRATTNPGGVGHEWVKTRFIENEERKNNDEAANEDRLFISAGIKDNPSLDEQSYRKSLQELDPVTRRQLEDGDWDVVGSGNFFRRDKFTLVDKDEVREGKRVVRYWDFASSSDKRNSKTNDPDYSVGVKMTEFKGTYYILDVIRVRKRPADIELLVKNTAREDGKSVEVFIEQEPGSSGVALMDHYSRNVLKGYSFKPIKSSGSKEDRAKPFAAAVDNGNVFLLRAHWNKLFVDECGVFPQIGFHDDQVDSASGSFNQLNRSNFNSGKIVTLPINRCSNICKGY